MESIQIPLRMGIRTGLKNVSVEAHMDTEQEKVSSSSLTFERGVTMFATFMKQPLCSSWSPRVGMAGLKHNSLATRTHCQMAFPAAKSLQTVEGQGGVG